VAGAYFSVKPIDSLAPGSAGDILAPLLFGFVGIAVSGLAGAFRQHANRLQEFERAVESLEEMIIVVDRDYRYLIANRAFLNYRGVKREDLIGRRVPEVLNPGVFEATIKDKVDEAFRGKVVQYEMRCSYPNHGERDLVISYFPIAGPDGIDRVACVLRDVTERKNAEDSLNESEDRYRDLVEHSEDLVCTHDLSGKLLSANPAPARVLGYEVSELLQMPMRELIAPDFRDQFDLYLEKIRTKGTDQGLLCVLTRSGERRIWEYKNTLRTEGVPEPIVRGMAHDVTERKRAELALCASEQRYRLLFEKNIAGVAIASLDGEVLDCNDAWAHILGYDSAREIQGHNASEFYFDVTEREPLREQLEHTGAFFAQEIQLRRKDGSGVWVLFDCAIRPSAGGQSILQSTAIDITERKKAEEELRDSELRYRTLFEKTIAGVGIISMSGRMLDCNDAWARMFGHTSAADCRGSQIQDHYRHPDQREPLLAELCQSGVFVNREWELRRKDGTPFWVLLNSVLIPQPDGEPLIQSTMFDITQRKQAEQALRDAKEFSENLIQTANVMILGLDTDGNVNLLNGAGEKITGYTFAELNGKSWSALVPRDRFPHVWREFDRLVAGTASETFENTILTKTGEERHIAWRSSVLKVNGKIVATISFGNDITECKHAEDALRRSEESYRNFVARSSEGIFRQDVDAPIPIDLPEDELVHRILHDSYLAECNEAIVKMYGLTSAQDLLGRRLTEFVDPADPVNVELTHEYIRSGFRLLERESRETDINGNEKVFRNSTVGIVEDGKLVRTWGIQRDVTEQVRSEHARREAEQALRKSEERFRVALKDSPITVFSQDPDLRYTWIYNPQLHWQHDALGKTDDEIIGPKKAAALNDLKRRVLTSGVGAREEVAIPQDGTSHVFDITIEPLFDAQKKVIGVTAACMDIARLREMADHLQESRDRLANTKSYLESEIQTELGFEEIIGQSPALREVLRNARIVAPTDSTVLLLGETGTGKELVARSVHALSSRHDNTFVKLNCAAVPSGLLESELFGHEKGAFTGAVNQKIGRIELADKGTLFLDEIGEMSLELQPKLLRVLQDREFERLGGVRTLHVDVRIISATNRDLRQDVAEKKFREDLFYRLNVFPMDLPPLRERRDDIPMLVQHFVRKHAVRMGKRIDTIPDDAMRVLRCWNWPGNVRELENMIERMVIMSKGSILAAPPAELSEAEYAAEDNLTEMERDHILRVLRETNGVLSGNDGAASRLGLKRTTLQSMIKRLGIHPDEYRSGAAGIFGRS
jgi:PAS domain S-box-containing protein